MADEMETQLAAPYQKYQATKPDKTKTVITDVLLKFRSYSLTAVVVVPGFGLTRVVFPPMLTQRASTLSAPS